MKSYLVYVICLFSNGLWATGLPNEKYQVLCEPRFAANLSARALPAKPEGNAGKAYQILSEKCASCHRPDSTHGAKTFADVLDSEDLLRRKLVVPGDSKSKLLQEVENGSMPPEGPPLSAEMKEALRDWILDGAKSFSGGVDSFSEVGFVSQEDLDTCMARDIASQSHPRTIRYVTLENIYNAGRRGELKTALLALNKLFNSLSWKPEIRNLAPVDGTGTVFRFDIGWYGWTAHQWESIAARYPFQSGAESTNAKKLSKLTATATPNVRGDWLVFTASKPPLYHDLLDLPVKHGDLGADRALEEKLSVNDAEQERAGTVTKVGLKKSKVTKSNRVINRFKTPYGAYWKSDDFEVAEGKQNILEHPFDYLRKGGEFIFNLPNGLQGYLVVDAQGNRLNEAPVKIVVDPLRQDKDGAVVNGISCFSCHTKGMKRNQDDVVPHFRRLQTVAEEASLHEKAGAFLKFIESAKRFYKEERELNLEFSQDEKKYSNAIALTGGSLSAPEPIYAVARAFESPLDLASMASELNASSKELMNIINKNLFVHQKLRMGTDGTVERESFNFNFRLLKELLAVGRGDLRPDFSDTDFDPTFVFVTVKPGPFYMGSSDGTDVDANGNLIPVEDGRGKVSEKRHLVRIANSFQIGKYEVSTRLYAKVAGFGAPSAETGSRPQGGLSWTYAQRFVKRLTQMRRSLGDLCSYRLPTEAEWEYAARGGNAIPDNEMQTPYFFGRDPKELRDFAVFSGITGIRTSVLPIGSPANVGSKKPNPIGLFDVYGNVWEWTEDAFREAYEELDPVDPVGRDGEYRVIRGGSFFDTADALRSARRQAQIDTTFENCGLRVVRDCGKEPSAN